MKKIATIIIFSFTLIIPNIFAQTHGTWTQTDSLHIWRHEAASVELANGNILVTGGADTSDIRSTELFDYKKEKWEQMSPMTIGRSDHKLVKLDNGNILAIAGFGTKSCEIYDTTTKSWLLTDSLKVAVSYGESVTLLNDGKVLVAGGLYTTRGVTRTLNTCEIYDPNTSKWSIVDSLKIDRQFHTATKLLDGRILVVGGSSWVKKELKDCEIYNPTTNEWSVIASLQTARYEHSATLLPNGKVLVSGGENYSNPTNPWLKSCELYDPSQNKWTMVDSLFVPHALHSSILLKNGLLLVAGGSINPNLWELYDPNNFENIYLGNFPSDTTATPLINLLPNGKVLFAGGITSTNGNLPILIPSKACYLYDPNGLDVISDRKITTPSDFKLYQNYPNPFNPATTIKYILPKTSFVSLVIFDILGRRIVSLVNKIQSAGEHSIKYDASNIPSGIYFYQISSEAWTKTKKMILIK